MIAKCRKHDCWPEMWARVLTWGIPLDYSPESLRCPLCTIERQYPEEVAKWNQQQAEKEREGDDKATDK